MILASGKKGFTLIELMVVVAMLALIMGAVTTSMSSAMQRARVEKASAEVKMLAQAIQAYAHYNKGQLTPIASWAPADFGESGNLKFLNGSGSDIPVLLQAALSGDGVMRDPWGSPYQVKIVKGSTIAVKPIDENLKSGFFLPNFYRLTEDEREGLK